MDQLVLLSTGLDCFFEYPISRGRGWVIVEILFLRKEKTMDIELTLYSPLHSLL